jgi:hypothetical protein
MEIYNDISYISWLAVLSVNSTIPKKNSASLRPATSLTGSVYVYPNFDTEDSLAWWGQCALAKQRLKVELPPTSDCKLTT